VVEQPQYNLLVRAKVEDEYRWLYEKYGLGLTIWSPLKQGILTGKYNGQATPPPGTRLAESQDKFTAGQIKTFGNEAWQRELQQVESLRPVAEKLGVTLAQLALAWVLTNKNVSSAIIGASRPEQVAENVLALDIAQTKLTKDVLDEIDSILGNAIPAPARRF